MRNNTWRTANRSGFTLIELLVVIAIVAALAAVLFPVFAGVRERGRRMVCQSNLKQIALAMQQYVKENGGVYPLDSGTINRSWVAYLFDWSQAIFPYVKNDWVFFCPDTPTDVPWRVGSMAGLGNSDYSYDTRWLNTFLPPYPTKNILGTREAMLATPSSIWLNEDKVLITADGVWHDGRDDPRSSCGQEGGGSTLHSGAGNYSYIDGHVKWLTPEKAGKVECLNGPLPAPIEQ